MAYVARPGSELLEDARVRAAHFAEALAAPALGESQGSGPPLGPKGLSELSEHPRAERSREAAGERIGAQLRACWAREGNRHPRLVRRSAIRGYTQGGDTARPASAPGGEG